MYKNGALMQGSLLKVMADCIHIFPFTSDEICEELVSTFERCSWEVDSGSFFDIEICRDSNIVLKVLSILQPIVTSDFRDRLFSELNFLGSGDFRVILQKYGLGSNVGVHTDSNMRELRVILCLNRGWEEQDGGVWIFSNDSDLKKNRRILPPVNNSAIGFVCGGESYHCMSLKNRNTSYSVVICFDAA